MCRLISENAMNTIITPEQMIESTIQIAKKVCIENNIEYDEFIAALDKAMDMIENTMVAESQA